MNCFLYFVLENKKKSFIGGFMDHRKMSEKGHQIEDTFTNSTQEKNSNLKSTVFFYFDN